MSSAPQEQGHGRQRQIDFATDYAGHKGLELITTFEGEPFEDVGSAYTGEHIATGQWGRFLNAIRARRIEPGSYLLVESLDRFDRREVMTAFDILREVIRAGIIVATTSDRREKPAWTLVT